MSQIIRQEKPVDARRQTNIPLCSLGNWLTFFLRDYELGSRRRNKHWGKKTSFSSCSSIIQMNKDICHIKCMHMSSCVFSVLCVWVCTHVYVCFRVFMYGCTQKCMSVCISACVHRSVLHLYSCECVCMSVCVSGPRHCEWGAWSESWADLYPCIAIYQLCFLSKYKTFPNLHFLICKVVYVILTAKQKTTAFLVT